MKNFLILSTCTDAGKTFLLTQICTRLRKKNISCDAIKPVASGFRDDDPQSDCALILRATGKNFSQKNLENITPNRFNAALAPNIAAKKENREINFLQLIDFCRRRGSHEYFFIEGAGGVMTPITDDKTFLDLSFALKIPVLLIARNYLGTISHTLCAVEALRSRGIVIEKIIINDYQNFNVDIKIDETISTIQSLSGVEVVDLESFLKNFIT